MRNFFWPAVLLGTLVALPAAYGQGRPKGRPAEPPHVSQDDRWADALLKAYDAIAADDKAPRSEAVRMLVAILKGERMGGESGWFGPSQTRYDWTWLRARDSDRDGTVSRKELHGPAELFDRLDRDGDGAIVAGDLDWSPASPFYKQQAEAMQLFRRIDGDGNGRVSKEEWGKLFDRAARAKDHLTADDLRGLLFPPSGAKKSDKKRPGKGGPPRQVLLRCLLQGDLGSPFEGPAVNEPAPAFTLPRHDGTGDVSLADYRGKKPVVLIFGSFT